MNRFRSRALPVAATFVIFVVTAAGAAGSRGAATASGSRDQDLEVREIAQVESQLSDSIRGAEEIHPWDNPQARDSTQLRGPSSELRPLFDTPPSVPSIAVTAGSETKTATLPGSLEQVANYPNPFNAETRIQFRLAEAGPVTLTIYNLLGQAVERADLGTLESGLHGWTWNGTLEGGRPAPSGIYFYRLESRAASAMSKMVLLK